MFGKSRGGVRLAYALSRFSKQQQVKEKLMRTETEAQKKARLAREKRERQQALVGLGIGAVILTVLIGAMSSQNRFVRYFSRGVFIVIVLAIIGLIVKANS